MGKPTKLGDLTKKLIPEKRTPLQRVSPILEKKEVKKFLMNMPLDTYEFLREKALKENTDMKTHVLNAFNEKFEK